MRIGLHKEEGHVHHTDEDLTNNTAGNLKIVHPGCHLRLHKKGKNFSSEHRAALSASLKGRQPRGIGWKHSAETRRKISESMKGNRNRVVN